MPIESEKEQSEEGENSQQNQERQQIPLRETEASQDLDIAEKWWEQESYFRDLKYMEMKALCVAYSLRYFECQ